MFSKKNAITFRNQQLSINGLLGVHEKAYLFMASSCQGKCSKDFCICIHGLDLWFNLTEGWKYNSSGSICCWWLKTGSQQLGFVIPLSTTGFQGKYEIRNSQMAFFHIAIMECWISFRQNEFGAFFWSTERTEWGGNYFSILDRFYIKASEIRLPS